MEFERFLSTAYGELEIRRGMPGFRKNSTIDTAGRHKRLKTRE